MIATLRAAAGLTQCQLAELIGVSQGALSNVERGARRPGAKTLIAVASALALTPAEIGELLAYYHAPEKSAAS